VQRFGELMLFEDLQISAHPSLANVGHQRGDDFGDKTPQAQTHLGLHQLTLEPLCIMLFDEAKVMLRA
jgi:hypothetical protein